MVFSLLLYLYCQLKQLNTTYRDKLKCPLHESNRTYLGLYLYIKDNGVRDQANKACTLHKRHDHMAIEADGPIPQNKYRMWYPEDF